jgi:2-hydroxycyclohexanecarboxyl-CoA dehydrogenase
MPTVLNPIDQLYHDCIPILTAASVNKPSVNVNAMLYSDRALGYATANNAEFAKLESFASVTGRALSILTIDYRRDFMGQLAAKVAVITGAAGEGNMGQAIARRLASEGATVVISGRHEAPMRALTDEIGGSYCLCDMTKKADQDALLAHIVETHGACHIAVNAAGMNLMKPILETSEADLDTIISVHLKGAYFFLQVFGGYMAANGGGSIVQISSATVDRVIMSHAAYIGTKAAGEAFVKCFANELGANGVKINVVAPGYTRTPMTAQASATPGLEAVFAAKCPIGRVGTSDDIADAVVWLSQDGSFISGQVLQINGGLTLRGNPTATEVHAAIAAAMAQ